MFSISQLDLQHFLAFSQTIHPFMNKITVPPTISLVFNCKLVVMHLDWRSAKFTQLVKLAFRLNLYVAMQMFANYLEFKSVSVFIQLFSLP